MQDDLKNKDSKLYREKREFAMRAFNGGCVIYTHGSRKWYTPREFMDSDETIEVKTFGSQDYANVTLMYPKHAIEKRLEDLRKAQEDFDAFMVKMLTAFELNPKPKPKNHNL